MIKIDNAFIENFKKITCLCDIKTQMGFNVIYDEILSKNDSDIKIIKTFIDFGGNFANILHTRFSYGDIIFNYGKKNSQNIMFCNAELSLQLRFFLSILLNFSGEDDFVISSEIMLKLSKIETVNYSDLCRKLINEYIKNFNKYDIYDETKEEEYEKQNTREISAMEDVINQNSNKQLYTIKNDLDIEKIKCVFAEAGKKITFENFC
jgi:hypothetical protein